MAAPPTSPTAAQLRHATKVYGPVTALDAVDMTISFAWLAGYAVVLFAVAGWAYRREEGRTFS